MEKIGFDLDKAIKSVNHEVYDYRGQEGVGVKTVVLFKNGYTTTEVTKVWSDKFGNYDYAKAHCIQMNIESLRKRLKEVKSYLDFLNNKELTLISNKEFDEYVRLKTQKLKED